MSLESPVSCTTKCWNKTEVLTLRKVFIHYEKIKNIVLQARQSFCTSIFFIFIGKNMESFNWFFRIPCFIGWSSNPILLNVDINCQIFKCLFKMLHQCLFSIDGTEPNRYPGQTVFAAWMELIISLISFSSRIFLNSMKVKVTSTTLWAMQRLTLVGIMSFIQILSDNDFFLVILEISNEFCLNRQNLYFW